jgi:membrane protein required for colicin V production
MGLLSPRRARNPEQMRWDETRRRHMSLSHWTFLDFIFVIILLVSTGFAFKKGLMRELISLAALLAAFLLAAFYYPAVAGIFRSIVKTDAIANLIGFMIIFLSVLVLGAIVVYLVNRFVKMASLEWMDRLLGGVFGFLRGWAVCSVIALATIAFPVRQDLIARSVFAPFLLAGARAAVLMVPQDMKAKFYEEYQKVLQSWNHDRSPK